MKSRIAIIAVTLALAGVSRAQAASITINQVPGTTYTTTGITDFSIGSAQMNGMLVTAFWKVGSGAVQNQTVAWNGGAFFTGSNFDLTLNGDTFDNGAWQLDFEIAGEGLLQKLVFDGVPGNTVFDRTMGGAQGTNGSDQGKDFAGFGQYCTGLLCSLGWGTQGNITATYFNQVRLNGNAPVGDIFAGFSMEFLSFGGLGERSDWSYTLDTDFASTQLVIQSTQSTPEPGTMVLFGTGLLGLAAAARRRARKA